MLNPLPMQKVRLIGLKSSQEQSLRLWQKLGVIHLTPLPISKLGLQEGRPPESYDALSEQLVRLRAIRSSLLPISVPPGAAPKDALAAARSLQIEDALLEIKGARERLSTEAAALAAQSDALGRLFGFDLDFSALPPAMDYYLFSLPSAVLPILRHSWSRHSWHSEWLTASDPSKKEHALALVAVPKGQDCGPALAGVERISLPVASGVPNQAVLRLRAQMAELEGRRRQLQARLQELSEHYYPLCVRLEETLTLAADCAQAAAHLGVSADCFYAEGWVKPGDVEMLQSKSAAHLGAKAMVQVLSGQEHRGIGMPTVLSNPAMAGPFQFLVEFLSLPRADEMDPSLLLLFTIPILYGMIVGDAGYALLSLALAAFIASKSQKGGMLWQFCRIWMIGAVPSFIFGVLFDEFFGYSHATLLGLSNPLYTAVISRVHEVPTLIVWSLVAGILHVGLGFVLGILNAWNHDRKHAYAKMGWLLVEAGGIFAVGYYLLGAFSPLLGMAGAATLAAGALVILLTEGPIGLVEIPSLASNLMSYSRIAAIGVGGVIMAEIINEFFAPNPQMLSTPVGMLTFALVALLYVFAHILNTGLAMFESFIHGARLNVVEFFGKFYHGGGIPFRPFAAYRQFTLERDEAPAISGAR